METKKEVEVEQLNFNARNKVLIKSSTIKQTLDTETCRNNAKMITNAKDTYFMYISSDDVVWYPTCFGQEIVPIDQIDEIAIVPWTDKEVEDREANERFTKLKEAKSAFNQRIQNSPNKIRRVG
jgi:hypothetical protein